MLILKKTVSSPENAYAPVVGENALTPSEKHVCYTIVMMASDGGVGKSMAAMAMGAYLSKALSRNGKGYVLLFDADITRSKGIHDHIRPLNKTIPKDEMKTVGNFVEDADAWLEEMHQLQRSKKGKDRDAEQELRKRMPRLFNPANHFQNSYIQPVKYESEYQHQTELLYLPMSNHSRDLFLYQPTVPQKIKGLNRPAKIYEMFHRQLIELRTKKEHQVRYMIYDLAPGIDMNKHFLNTAEFVYLVIKPTAESIRTKSKEFVSEIMNQVSFLEYKIGDELRNALQIPERIKTIPRFNVLISQYGFPGQPKVISKKSIDPNLGKPQKEKLTFHKMAALIQRRIQMALVKAIKFDVKRGQDDKAVNPESLEQEQLDKYESKGFNLNLYRRYMTEEDAKKFNIDVYPILHEPKFSDLVDKGLWMFSPDLKQDNKALFAFLAGRVTGKNMAEDNKPYKMVKGEEELAKTLARNVLKAIGLEPEN